MYFIRSCTVDCMYFIRIVFMRVLPVVVAALIRAASRSNGTSSVERYSRLLLLCDPVF